MKTERFSISIAAAALCGLVGVVSGETMGTAFTYQGQLKQAGVPVNATCEFEFSLWDTVAGPAQVGSTLTFDGRAGHQPPISVVNGLFTVKLDFGNAFDGDARWLEIAVCCPPGDCGGPWDLTTLDPRQKLTPTPLALALPGLYTRQNATSPNLIGGFGGNSVTLGAIGATIGGGGSSTVTNRITDHFGTIGGGLGNRAGDDAGAPSDAMYATVGGGYTNTASGESATIGGGRSNVVSADYGTIAGGGESDPGTSTTANFVYDDYGTVGGGGNNKAGSDDADPTTARFATVGGGGQNDASEYGTTVGGGLGNTASVFVATVGGGAGNTASGTFATVGGGRFNTASEWSATVGGGYTNTATGESATIGGGRSNVVSADYGTIAGGGESDPGTSTTANFVYDDYGTVGGGGNNKAGSDDADPTTARFATVGGGSSNTASRQNATVGGGVGNTARGYVYGASTVGGGEANTASGDYSTVGGGHSNTAGFLATVGGGSGNNASHGYSTVAGGASNTASESYSTVGGGRSNTASGEDSTVGGGYSNDAAGDCSVCPGGCNCSALGAGSFAAGTGANALHDGSFVWADASSAQLFSSKSENEFCIRATGGTELVSAVDQAGNPSASVTLSPGGNAWSTLSSRSSKANFAAVNGRDILDRLAGIPIETWNYKAQNESIRHIGPMAGDFHTAFGVGEDEKLISTIDADGVALAAVKGLYEIVKEKNADITALQMRLIALEQSVGKIGPSARASTSGMTTPALAALSLVGFLAMARSRKGGAR